MQHYWQKYRRIYDPTKVVEYQLHRALIEVFHHLQYHFTVIRSIFMVVVVVQSEFLQVPRHIPRSS